MPMKYITYPLVSALLFGITLTPSFAFAATKKAACEVSITTKTGTVTAHDDTEVYVTKGESVTIAWDTDNAKTVSFNGTKVSDSGKEVVTPTKKTTYKLSVSGTSSKKVSCDITTIVADASITASSLSSTSSKPTISGKATGVKKVQVIVRKAGETKILSSKSVRVKSGKWNAKVSKELSDGTYDVSVLGDKKASGTLTTSTLTVGKGSTAAASGNATLSVSSVPLLFGGTTSAGASVPVSYLQIVNTGKAPAVLSGVWLKQNGSASVRAISGLEVRDDSGTTRGSTGVMMSTPFNGSNMAKAPMNVTLNPGERRLFTVRVMMNANLMGYFGQNLMIDVTSVEANGKAMGAFPIKGTTWTIR